MPYRMIDLCAGIGGIRRGFELAGEFENVLSAEIDSYACKTYEHLFGENPLNDLTSDSFKAMVDRTEYDVLLAGFPCQTFSRAGLQEGFENETRGVIFTHIAEIIERTMPGAIFLENVDYLLTHDGGTTFALIIDILESRLNYKIIGIDYDDTGTRICRQGAFVRNSRHFGVPQNRPRTYIMGFSRARYPDADNIEEMLPTERNTMIYDNINDILERHAAPEFYMSQGYFDTLVAHRARQKNKGNGFGYRIINAPGIVRPIANTLLATGGSGKERNLVIDEQPGIPGMMVGSKKTPLNDRCIRVLTPREWGLLQGFANHAFLNERGEDMFSFPEGMSNAQKYKQLGNSVTIPVIQTMAEFMLTYLRRWNM